MFKKLSPLILGLGLLIVGSSPASNNLPTLSDFQNIDHEREQRLGREFFSKLDQAGLLDHNPLMLSFLNDLGERLTTQLPQVQYAYHFYIVKNAQVNAFALPGGHIGIHTGLILEFDSVDQLAAVMAHEIAHVYQQHSLQLREQAGRATRGTLAAFLAAILLGQQDIDLASATIIAATAGQQQSLINFTRENEYEADRIGIELMQRAGFNGEAMAETFEKLGKLKTGTGIEYLQTHPVSSNRIAEARHRAEKHLNDQSHPKFESYAIIKDWAAFHYANSFNQADSNYAKALLAQRQGHIKTARLELEKLHQRSPADLWISDSLIELYTQSDQFDAAQETLESLMTFHPQLRFLQMKQAELLIERQHYSDAEKSLLQLKIDQADDPALYPMLVKVFERQGQVLRAAEAKADYLRITGEKLAAIRQYETITEAPDSPPSLSLKAQQRIDQLKLAISEEKRKNRRNRE